MSTKTRTLTVAFALVLAVTVQTQAAITYVDATSTNTTVNGGAMIVEPGAGFNVGDNGGNSTDDLWSERPFGTNGNIFTVHSGETVTDTLTTTVSGLASGTYHVYAYMASAGTSWDIRVDLNGGTPIEVHAGDLGTVLASTQTIIPAVVTELSAGIFLWAVDLGTFSGTGFTVNVDHPDTTDARTWYDGVGYELVSSPVPAPAALPAGLALLGMIVVRRRRHT